MPKDNQTEMYYWSEEIKDDIIFFPLTFTANWVNSADNKSEIFFIFVPENRVWHFKLIVFLFAWNV